MVVAGVFAWGVSGDALCADLSCCVLATWVGSVVISVGWSDLDAFALGSASPSSGGGGVSSWNESMEMSFVCLMWSSSIALTSPGLPSVCVSFDLSFGAVGSGSVALVVLVEMSGGGLGGGCGCGFFSVRRIR